VIGEGGGISLGLLYTLSGSVRPGPISSALTSDEDRPMRIAIGLSYVAMGAGCPCWRRSELRLGPVGAMVRAMGGGTVWVFSTQLLSWPSPRGARPGLRQRVRPLTSPWRGAPLGGSRPRPRGAPTEEPSDDGRLDPGPGSLGSLASPTLRKILGTPEGPVFV
jgi:hypothetical protein